jgi:hypothetical protein
MSSLRLKAFDYALRAVRRDSSRHRSSGAAGAAGRAEARREPSMARRELDSFRRSQGMPYWHHDHH